MVAHVMLAAVVPAGGYGRHQALQQFCPAVLWTGRGAGTAEGHQLTLTHLALYVCCGGLSPTSGASNWLP